MIENVKGNVMDISGQGWKVLAGSCLDRLKELEDNSIDAVVTDPPYELGFMGKSWDSSGIAFNVEVWAECLRVLKPGGHLLAFGGSRTWHRIAVAIEDAGFEVRDSIAWLYGSGFPKSLDVSKAIDKAAGVEREVVGSKRLSGNAAQTTKEKGGTFASNTNSVGVTAIDVPVTAPATPEAQKWQGWGTALKPAFEPVVVARKPLTGTVAGNVLEWGVGGLNIDGTRIGTETIISRGGRSGAVTGDDREGAALGMYGAHPPLNTEHTGRWPSNVMLDEFTAALVDEQSGVSVSKSSNRGDINIGAMAGYGDTRPTTKAETSTVRGHNDSGGASRFFYVADTQKHDIMSPCKNTPANIVANYFKTIRAIIENSAQTTADMQPNEQLDQTVKSAEILCDSCATSIAHDLAALKYLATNKATSTHFRRYIKDCVNSTLSQNLALFVETWGNTDTTPTMTSFGRLFGCVLLATDENIRLENLVNGNVQTPFIYQAKASKRDRNEGLDGLEAQRHSDREKDDGVGGDNPRNRTNQAKQNFHPTVKPTDLMRQLVRLVTPLGGTVLDPFTGSGSTGKAAILEGMQFIGCELTEDYLHIIQGRIDWAVEQVKQDKLKAEQEQAEVLF